MYNCSNDQIQTVNGIVIAECLALGFLCVFSVVANIVTIWLVLRGASVGQCPVNTMMLSTQGGNMVSASSFFLHLIYYISQGYATTYCIVGSIYSYFFNYLGALVMIITMLFSSINTYNGVVKKSWMLTNGRRSTMKTFVVI